MYHIAILTWYGKGHSLPMTSAARTLVEADERVCVSVYYPRGPGLTLPELEHPRVKIRSFPIPVEACVMTLDTWKVMRSQETYVVQDCVAEMRAADWGVPVFFLFDMCATWTIQVASILNRPHGLILVSPIGFLYAAFFNHLRLPSLEIPGQFGRLRQADLPHGGPYEEAQAYHFRRLIASGVVLANDCSLFYRDDALKSSTEALLQSPRPAVYMTGLWALSDPRLNLPDPALKWLDTQRPNSVLYIALGSWCPIPVHDVVELARGLQLTAQPFLWAYRENSSAAPYVPHAPKGYIWPAPREPTARDGLPVRFREDVADKAMICSWVNQPAVLRHPSIRAFVTHCGWNSLTEALALSGKPIIGLPLMAEQSMNAILVEQLGIGVRLWRAEHPRHLNRSEVMAKILHTLASEHIKLKAERLHQVLRSHAQPGGRAVTEIRSFLEREVFRRVDS